MHGGVRTKYLRREIQEALAGGIHVYRCRWRRTRRPSQPCLNAGVVSSRSWQCQDLYSGRSLAPLP